MQIFSDVGHELGPEGFRVGRLLGFCLLDDLANFVLDHVGIFEGVEVWDLTNVEKIVDILKDSLVENLIIDDEEDSLLFFDPDVMHHVTEELVPVLVAELAVNVQLEQLIVLHVDRQSDTRPFPRSTEAHEQSIRILRLNHSVHL